MTCQAQSSRPALNLTPKGPACPPPLHHFLIFVYSVSTLPEESVATHSSILAWRIPWTEEPGGLQPIGSQKVGCDSSDLAPTVGSDQHTITKHTTISVAKHIHILID